MHFADRSRGRPFAKDPAVVRLADRCLMYYSLPPYGDGRPDDGWAIGIAESRDLDHWTPIGALLPEQPCEAKGLCAAGVLVRDGRVHLFYQTYGNGARDAICHAESLDGLRFRRNPANPIFRPEGPWTCGRAIDADVVVFKDRLLLFYATRDPAMAVQMLGGATADPSTGLGTASWTPLSNDAVLRPELPWEHVCIEAPAVVVREERLVLFYGGGWNNEPQQIGVAVSDDGIRWQRLAAEPFLANGPPGSWNSSESGHPFVFADADGRTHLFYQGNPDGGATWHLSRVEIGWQGWRPHLLPR